VRLGRRVEAVDRFGGDREGGVKSKGAVGDADIVVNGLGDADDRNAQLDEIQGAALRAVAPDRDQDRPRRWRRIVASASLE